MPDGYNPQKPCIMKTNLWTDGKNRTGKLLCALCAVALSAAFTGCEYDDADINNRMDQLEKRVTELEKDMKTQIEAVQQMLDGKLTIASCTYDKATGLYTVVLSNGDVLTVAAAAGEGASLIGVAEEDGAYYWTLNGEPLKDAAGNKLPVAVAPGIRVNTATNEWEVSPDGGKTWLGTGITAEEGASLFAKVEEDEGFVYFTLGDGTRLKVARSTDFHCTPLAGKQYFTAGQTRTVKLDMSDVKKSTITKPDGWKAVIENSELKITAPAAENSYAETGGKVAVVAVASNGQSSISEVGVEIDTPPHEITIDADLNVTITIDSKLAQEWLYEGYYYGVRKLSEFSPEQVLEYIRNDDRTRPIKKTTTTTLEAMLGAKPEQGVSYVVYAVDSNYDDSVGAAVLDSPEEMLYTVAQSIYTKIEITDVTYENAKLSVEAMGVSECWAQVVPAADYNPSQILEDIQDSFWAPAKVSAKYSGWLSGYAGGIKLQAGREYIVWVLPVVPGKRTSSYTEENIYTQKVTITDITMGGDASVVIGEVTSSATDISATVTPGTGVYKFYSAYKTEAEYLATRDEEWPKQLIASGTATAAPNTFTVAKSGLKPEAKGYILSVAVTKEGKAGPMVKKNADTKALAFSAETPRAEAVEVTLKSAKIKLTGSDNIVSYRYMNQTHDSWINGFLWKGDEKATENELALATEESYNYKFIDGSNVEIPFDNLKSGTDYHFFAVGVDKEGLPTRLLRVDYTPTVPSDKFAKKDSELWTANYAQRPQVTNITTTPKGSGTGFHTVTADVAVGEKCAAYWIYTGVADPTIGKLGALNKTVSILSNSSTKPFNGNQTTLLLSEWGSASNNIFVVWQDTDGNYYEYEQVAKYVEPDPKPAE